MTLKDVQVSAADTAGRDLDERRLRLYRWSRHLADLGLCAWAREGRDAHERAHVREPVSRRAGRLAMPRCSWRVKSLVSGPTIS